MKKRGSKRRKLSTRSYGKKAYWTADKGDLRKSFPKGAMVIWALICLVGAIFVWQYSGIISIILLILAWTFISYLWGSKTWGYTNDIRKRLYDK